MRRQKRQDRRTRLHQFHQTLSPVQKGVFVSVLLGNALLVVTVDGVVAVAIVRGAIRSWRRRRLGPVAAVRTGIGPAAFGVLVAAAMQWALSKGFVRAVDTGTAAAWLKQSERWLSHTGRHIA